jgi:hypothetical protein
LGLWLPDCYRDYGCQKRKRHQQGGAESDKSARRERNFPEQQTLESE